MFDQKKNTRRRTATARTLEQPERQQRLHDKSAGESIDAEQRGELVDGAARWPERRGVLPLRALGVRHIPVQRRAYTPSAA